MKYSTILFGICRRVPHMWDLTCVARAALSLPRSLTEDPKPKPLAFVALFVSESIRSL